MSRIFNFNPGPSTLPLPVLEKIQAEFLDYDGTGMSVMELSHRGKDFINILADTKKLCYEVMEIPENYQIIFTTGGASTQFAMIPMNFLHEGSGDYIDTGSWSAKAIKEAKIQGKMYNVAASTKGEDGVYRRIPTQDELKLDSNARYLHVTTNNTIFGTQYKTLPDSGDVPLICDMSSDIAANEIDFNKNIGLIYAGAQKNLGPAGVTLVIIRDDMLEKAAKGLPSMLTYQTYIDKDSAFNTPPTFPIYVVKLVLEWIKETGGVAKIQEINEEKGRILYDIMDKYPNFYKGTTEVDSRSLMNATLRLPNENLEKTFVAEAGKLGLGGLKGHRSVGGIRVSMYNAMTLEGVQKLVDFMEDFHRKNA